MNTIKSATRLLPYFQKSRVFLSTFHTTSRLLDGSPKNPNQPFANKMFGKKPPEEDEGNEFSTYNNTTTKNEKNNTNQKQNSSKHLQLTKGPPVKKSFVIDENDLEEKFVIGSGPGGQHLNKTSTTCFLKHKPTGVFVKCNTTRSLPQNRKLAREILNDKIDHMLNGKLSKIEQEREKIRKSKSKRRRRGFGGSTSDSPENASKT
eukprot:Phypoly_transcript_05445.p1 GENE.Phypoly_transcript_05445~~Phypoly_transcript_05445.p1  ORF type:complete len:205 (+),score=40.89 Phypoly_transcript_05445:65-679(+)